MRVEVDPDLCISCGVCVEVCPDVFEWDDEEKARAAEDEVSDDLEECAHEAVEGCPTEAIKEM
ncbi:MAG: ferredoxin [Eubacteriales bacterium]|jgi:ferredoxin|nr:ferredoxin [Bacillota bacterium]MBV1726878.1 ferredoxin [Desulforudis sp.]MDP3051834.1 ferredoxin [Eubacteriales bacterium]MDQ7788577.1 ferredoxin [Clostridia bacterium]MBU4553338.1 ferredoxin [Bacillota bacterium]